MSQENTFWPRDFYRHNLEPESFDIKKEYVAKKPTVQSLFQICTQDLSKICHAVGCVWINKMLIKIINDFN